MRSLSKRSVLSITATTAITAIVGFVLLSSSTFANLDSNTDGDFYQNPEGLRPYRLTLATHLRKINRHLRTNKTKINHGKQAQAAAVGLKGLSVGSRDPKIASQVEKQGLALIGLSMDAAARSLVMDRQNEIQETHAAQE